ncbi:MAG: metallophosphoesterase family protein [Chloroflexi bacterium]|nr:metallophosphoesterase family protein [Chloroflexota bacterium]
MRILIISDIHANLGALDKVLIDAGTFDKVWCLGDVVGYGPQPNITIERLRSLDALCIAGNHDWAVLDRLDLDEFNPEARKAVLWTRQQLDLINLEWLKQLPERVPTQAEKFSLIHGSPRYPIWEYILTPPIARANFEYFDTPFCFFGHTHVPIIYQFSEKEGRAIAHELPEILSVPLGPEKMLVNPGSVGQPRDGDTRAAYAILNLDSMTLTHHRVRYDIKSTQVKMQQAGLPSRLIQRLGQGW